MYELDNAVEKERKCDNEWKDSLEYFKTSKMTHFRRVRFKNVLFPVLFQRLIFNLHIHVVFFLTQILFHSYKWQVSALSHCS